MAVPVLEAQGLVLRPPRAGDEAALEAILAEPEVARWWGVWDAERVRELVGGHGWAIEVGGTVAGWLQYDEETDPDYRHVALDVFLATAVHGRGHGRAAIRLVLDHFVAQGHHRFSIDPSTANERAIRAYAAVGFRPVGILRAYERGPDGTWRDALLMDLLAGELEAD